MVWGQLLVFGSVHGQPWYIRMWYHAVCIYKSCIRWHLVWSVGTAAWIGRPNYNVWADLTLPLEHDKYQQSGLPLSPEHGGGAWTKWQSGYTRLHIDSHKLTLGIPLQASATPQGSLAQWGLLWLSVLHGPNSLSGTQSIQNHRNNRGGVHHYPFLHHGNVKGSHLSKVTTLPCPIVSCAVELVTV